MSTTEHQQPGEVTTRYLSLVATHLNAAVGPVVSAAALADVLRAGSVGRLEDDPKASSVILSVFTEIAPHQIVCCLHEAGSSIEAANTLYSESQAAGCPRSLGWEQATRHLM